MTLDEFIEKLVELRNIHNAGEYSVKVPYHFDMEIQGSFTPWEGDTDITEDEICLNAKDKTLYITDKSDITKSYWSN